MLEDWGILRVLNVSHFCCPVTRLQGSQWPCVPPSRQGSILLAALVRPPGIIVAIGLMRGRVTPNGTPWRLLGRRNGRKNFFCGGPKTPISELGGEIIAGVCTLRYTIANFHDPPPSQFANGCLPTPGAARGTEQVVRRLPHSPDQVARCWAVSSSTS